MKFWKNQVLAKVQPTHRVTGKTRMADIPELWLRLPDGSSVWIMQ
jgi:hypothetical protein